MTTTTNASFAFADMYLETRKAKCSFVVSCLCSSCRRAGYDIGTLPLIFIPLKSVKALYSKFITFHSLTREAVLYINESKQQLRPYKQDICRNLAPGLNLCIKDLKSFMAKYLVYLKGEKKFNLWPKFHWEGRIRRKKHLIWIICVDI